ncbi:MAG: hypothetical protein NC111_02745 [Bacteroides sp.]|nr:hypothetical protein [Bacteroides sp.]MCM1413254.1 hypothetical protein [Bacteroides sp.]MCM1471436.1 hypothetical protein [Bacteroides sp.]
MKLKPYLPPVSTTISVATEQGICYSSNEEAKIQESGDVNVEQHIEIDNDITFD